MLTDLNDTSQPIEDILDQYFDRENLTYWMAYQILTGNVDTQNRNTYLYSPQNSDTWYLIAWDNDGSFMRTEYNIQNRFDQGSWECGVSNYWENVLFQRCLQSEDFREELDAAIQDLRSYLSVDRISSMIEEYRTVTQKYLNQMPDQMYAPLTEAKYETIASAIPSEVEQNYELYKESLEKPMPFYIGKPVIKGNILKFNWTHRMTLMQRRSLTQLNWQKIISLMRLYFVRIIFKFRKRRLQFRQMVSILCVSVRQIHLDRRRMLLIIM